MSVSLDSTSESSDYAFNETFLNDEQVAEVYKLINIGYAIDVYDKYIYLSKEIYEKFKDLHIIVDWHVPISHQSIKYNCPLEVKNEMSNLGLEVKTTSFDHEESELLIANWQSFKEKYDFDDAKYFLPGFLPRNVFRDCDKRLFLQCLGRGLPQRTLRSIYSRFYEIFAGQNFGRFTYVEDQILLAVKSSRNKYFQKHSKLKVLTGLLGRKKIALIHRYRILTKEAQLGGLAAPINWNHDLCRKLVSALIKETRATGVADLEHMDLAPHWEKIGQMLGVHEVHVIFFWTCQFAPLLFAKRCISRNKIRCFLILWFLARPQIKMWKQISWFDVALALLAPRFLCFRVFQSMVITYVPEDLWDNVHDCAQHLFEKYFDLFKFNKLKDRYLKRIYME